MSEEKILLSPDVCSSVDEEHRKLYMEVSLPGVEKENINLKVHEDGCSLTAPRENIVYVAVMSFCCPVDPDQTEAKYKNGLLKIEIPFKEFDETAVKVPVE